MNPTQSQPERPEPDVTCEFCDSKGPESSMIYSDDGYVCKRCYSAAQEAFNREWQILEVGELILATDEWHDGENWGPSSRVGEEVREGDEGDYRRKRVATRTAPEAVAVMNLEIKDGEIVQAPTPPVEADKDAEIAKLRARLDSLESALDGRLGVCPGKDELLIAIQEYIASEDALPDWFDTEDYSLSKSVQSLARKAVKFDAMEDEVARLREENSKLNRDLLDSSEDWAFCGIHPSSETAKKLVEHHRQREQERTDLTTARATITELEEKLKTYVACFDETRDEAVRLRDERDSARATIAERDKRIAELNTLAITMQHGRSCSVEIGMREDESRYEAVPCDCGLTKLRAAIAHAAEGKEQA